LRSESARDLGLDARWHRLVLASGIGLYAAAALPCRKLAFDGEALAR
jgi:hypothetical protein